MLKFVVKIGYEQFTFDNGTDALAFARSAKTHITDKDVTVKLIVEYENLEEEDTEDEEG